MRIRKAGGKILLVSEIKVYYLCDNPYKMLKKYFYNGFLVMEPLLIKEFPFSSRHIIPMIFVGHVYTAVSCVSPRAVNAFLYRFGFSAILFRSF